MSFLMWWTMVVKHDCMAWLALLQLEMLTSGETLPVLASCIASVPLAWACRVMNCVLNSQSDDATWSDWKAFSIEVINCPPSLGHSSALKYLYKTSFVLIYVMSGKTVKENCWLLNWCLDSQPWWLSVVTKLIPDTVDSAADCRL